MKILFVASEVYPIAKTGGLADVAGSLPKALAARGHQVSVMLPRYGSVRPPAETVATIRIPPADDGTEEARVERTFLDPEGKVPVYLICHHHYFGSRSELYAFKDDGFRFAFFSRAVVEAIRALRLDPEVLHCHDWHTALVPAYLSRPESHQTWSEPPAKVFTIHNLCYQGVFGREVFTASGLPPSTFTPEGVEFYGKVNFLKAGIVYSDRVNTVSPTYALEIQTPERGHGLDGLLRHSRDKLSGIVNGIDYEVWDPETDPEIPVRFGPGDLEKKAEMKRALQLELGLSPDAGKPLFSFVGRLVDQKGMDLIMSILDRLLETAQVAILGTGDPVYHDRLKELDGKGSLAILLKYDERLAHRMYAGSDGFLMPSWFEPCGLGQLIALRYGTLPIVRRTGGLSDTVRDADEDPAGGTGFSFDDYRPESLLAATGRAVAAYRDRARWSRLVSRAMAQDFSWAASTEKYEALYRSARAGCGAGRDPGGPPI